MEKQSFVTCTIFPIMSTDQSLLFSQQLGSYAILRNHQILYFTDE